LLKEVRRVSFGAESHQVILLCLRFAIYAINQRNKAATAQQEAEKEQMRAERKEKEAIEAAAEAKRQQGIAEEQRRVALVRLAHYFASVSKASIETQPTLSILLSIEALKAASISAAEEALRNTLAKIFASTPLA
jgi:hypothetical protein